MALFVPKPRTSNCNWSQLTAIESVLWDSCSFLGNVTTLLSWAQRVDLEFEANSRKGMFHKKCRDSPVSRHQKIVLKDCVTGCKSQPFSNIQAVFLWRLFGHWLSLQVSRSRCLVEIRSCDHCPTMSDHSQLSNCFPRATMQVALSPHIPRFGCAHPLTCCSFPGIERSSYSDGSCCRWTLKFT